MDGGQFAVYVALAAGGAEAVKRAGLPSRFAPLVSLLLGILIALGTEATAASGLTGAVIGLTASGLYSGTKAVAKG